MGKKSVRERFLSFIALILFAVFSSYTGKLSAGELDPEPKVYYIKINSRGTYLSPPKCFPATETDPERCDSLQPPTTFSLLPLMQDEEIPLKPGDFIGLQSIGVFDLDGHCQEDGVGCEHDETRGGVYAVFHGPSGFLFPGPEGTTHGEVGAWADIPQDFVLDEGLEIWAQVPEGATELLFTPNDDFFKDNLDTNGDYQVVAVTVVSCVYQLSVELSDAEVIPADTKRFGAIGKESTMVDVTLSCANNPDPKPELLANKTIHFLSKAKEKSGGHDHVDNRPTGEFEEDTCVTDSSGKCSSPVKYTPSMFGGIEEIYAGMDGKEEAVNDMKELTVKVPGLRPFPGGLFWRFSGDTKAHPDNHYVDLATLNGAAKLALSFHDTYGATLGFNDMSLKNGGLFDIGPTRKKPGQKFWNGPHGWHRVGRSVDIDHCAKLFLTKESPFSRDYHIWDKKEKKYIKHTCRKGFIGIEKVMITLKCTRVNGYIVDEAGHHCEFKGRK